MNYEYQNELTKLNDIITAKDTLISDLNDKLNLLELHLNSPTSSKTKIVM